MKRQSRTLVLCVPAFLATALGLTCVVAPNAGATTTPSGLANSSLWSFGKGRFGTNGNGSRQKVWTPVEDALPGVTQVSGSSHTTYALRSDGTVWAFGSGALGQLGNGTTRAITTVPVRVHNLSDVTEVTATALNGYALRADGTVWAWGDNWYGSLGAGFTGDYSDVPVQLPGLSDIVAVSGGLALRADGTVWTFDNGQLPGFADIVSIDSRYAVRSDGTLWGWDSANATAYEVGGLTDVKQVANFTGSNKEVTTYVLKNDGTVWWFGANHAYQINATLN